MIKVFGDSHVGFMARADDGSVPDLTFVPSHGRNTAVFTVEETAGGLHIFSDRHEGAPALDTVLSPADINVFSGPLHSSRFSRDRTWQRFCPWQVAEQFPDHTPIPTAVFEALVAQHVNRSQALATRCADKGIPLVVLEPPLLKPIAAEFPGTDPRLLADVDRRFRASVKRRLRRRGAEVIETPAQTNDGDFVLPDFASLGAEDLHHGSRSYYRLAIECVLDFAAAHSAGAAPA